MDASMYVKVEVFGDSLTYCIYFMVLYHGWGVIWSHLVNNKIDDYTCKCGQMVIPCYVNTYDKCTTSVDATMFPIGRAFYS